MVKQKQTDNHDPRAKLELRRYFLRTYHNDSPCSVLDCCQGSGLLWKQLRTEFSVRSYWGLDEKPKKGRLKVDSTRVLAQPGWTQDVIDIDTYGSPWKHWVAMLPNITKPTTVFLTIGQWHMGADSAILKAIGIGDLKIPPGIAGKLHGIYLSYLLTICCEYGIKLREVIEAVSDASVRYIGVRLEK